jgi:hypothetical protein
LAPHDHDCQPKLWLKSGYFVRFTKLYGETAIYC